MEVAKEIAMELDINPGFRTKRKITRKKQFDEGPADAPTESHSTEEAFRINYFMRIVDQAISSLKTRFEQYQEYETTFGFLFTSDRLRSLDDESLKDACLKLEAALKHEKVDETLVDIDGEELWRELSLIQDLN